MPYVTPFGESIPNPPEGPPLNYEFPRYGEGTPLPVKLSNAYPGKASGAHTKQTVTSTPQALPNDPFANSYLIQVQDAPLRFRVDGSTPTATGGFRAEPGDYVWITGQEDIHSFLAIRETSTNATMYIQPFV
jgi:hypothetical protein